jgi:hypothetical protein
VRVRVDKVRIKSRSHKIKEGSDCGNSVLTERGDLGAYVGFLVSAAVCGLLSSSEERCMCHGALLECLRHLERDSGDESSRDALILSAARMDHSEAGIGPLRQHR